MVSNWLIVFAVSNAMLLPEMGNRLDVYLYSNSARPSIGGLMHRYCFPDYQSSFFSYYTKYATLALLASRASVTNSKRVASCGIQSGNLSYGSHAHNGDPYFCISRCLTV